MRFVVFDDDTMEPITVVNLHGVTERDLFFRMDQRIRLPVIPEHSSFVSTESPNQTTFDVVELRFERFLRRGQFVWMCFSREAELAMLLEPTFLPGQRGYVQAIERHNEELSRLLLKAVLEQR